jgi:hypothetical protein
MSNMKQIGLGLMQYTQDNDEHYPPAWHGLNNGKDANPDDIESDSSKPGGLFIAIPNGSGTQNHYRTWMDFIFPYVKSTQIFVCPSSRVSTSTPNYGYSNAFSSYNNAPYAYTGDLSTVSKYNIPISLATVTRPSEVICIMENSDSHSYSTSASSYRSEAMLTDSPKVLPHLDGGNEVYADGHAKWRSRQAILSDLGTGDTINPCYVSNISHPIDDNNPFCSLSWNPYRE